MHSPRERALRKATIGAGDHILPADQLGEPDNALRDQLGVLDDVGGMADQAGKQHPALRQPDLLPYPPLVLVSRIRHLERIAADSYPQHEIDDVLDRDVIGVRPVPAAPAKMVARLLRGNARAWFTTSTRTDVHFR